MLRPLLLTLAVVAAGCTSTPTEPITTGSQSDLAAPADGGPVFFSLRTGEKVSAADSATTAWDLAFRGTEVRINGGSSGPGAGIGVVVALNYLDVDDALLDSVAYRRDGEAPCPSGPARSVCTGAGHGWFETQAVAGGTVVVPIPGRTLLLRLGDGQGFGKVQFISYYRGAPTVPTAASVPGYYTFDYTIDPDGTAFVEDD